MPSRASYSSGYRTTTTDANKSRAHPCTEQNFTLPSDPGRFVSECYPFTTIVGAQELGYAKERPRYKRRPKGVCSADFRTLRNAECDELIRRVNRLKEADPPINLCTHAKTRRLVAERSPVGQKDYKHREDLLDAALCAWTGALWTRWGEMRCQVLGRDEASNHGGRATIIAPARPEQRLVIRE